MATWSFLTTFTLHKVYAALACCKVEHIIVFRCQWYLQVYKQAISCCTHVSIHCQHWYGHMYVAQIVYLYKICTMVNHAVAVWSSQNSLVYELTKQSVKCCIANQSLLDMLKANPNVLYSAYLWRYWSKTFFLLFILLLFCFVRWLTLSLLNQYVWLIVSNNC